MKNQPKNRYVAVTRQVDGVRKLYSKIGQPLPADIIIDLHHYLGRAMEIAEVENQRFSRKKNNLRM